MPKNYAAELCIRVGRRFIWFGAILFGLVLCVVFSAHLDLRTAECGVRPSPRTLSTTSRLVDDGGLLRSSQNPTIRGGRDNGLIRVS